jgi:hypothetical protein
MDEVLLAFSVRFGNNKSSPTCGVPQAQKPSVSNHGGFCFMVFRCERMFISTRIVVEELGLPVGLLCPVPKPAGGLANVASFIRHIRIQHLQAAQFPDAISGTVIVRPSTWH